VSRDAGLYAELDALLGSALIAEAAVEAEREAEPAGVS
jgi:hypothetical protein